MDHRIDHSINFIRGLIILILIGFLVIQPGKAASALKPSSPAPASDIAKPNSQVEITQRITQSFNRLSELPVAPQRDMLSVNYFWTSRASMPTPRQWVGLAAAANGKIYAIGGYDGSVLNLVEEYDPTSDTWTSRANMPTNRSDFGVATAPNGKIYAIGGWNNSYLSTVEEYDPVNNTWATRASMPTARYGLAVAPGSNGKIYAVGGVDVDGNNIATVEEYDPVNDTWVSRASMAINRREPGIAATYDGKIYVMGGSRVGYDGDVLDENEEYDIAANTWTTRASMPTARTCLGAALGPDGKVYAIGGAMTTVEAFNPSTDTWETIPGLATALNCHSSARALNGKIYVVGGWGASGYQSGNEELTIDVPGSFTISGKVTSGGSTGVSGVTILANGGANSSTDMNGDYTLINMITGTYTITPSKVGYTFTPSSRQVTVGPGQTGVDFQGAPSPTGFSWVSRTSMPTVRSDFGLASGSNGRIYAIGGRSDTSDLSTVEEYDPLTDSWATRASMPTARRGLVAVSADNGRIYAIGGQAGATGGTDDPILNIVEEYNPATNAWTTRANMPTARTSMGAATATNGKIYVMGGYNWQTGTLYSTNEEYDPISNTWRECVDMPTARAYLGVSADSNGKVYAIGGTPVWNSLSVVEEYNPAMDSWTSRVNLPTARHALSVAASYGKIYAIGGWKDSGPLSTAEEYDPTNNTWMAITDMPTARSGTQATRGSNGNIYVIGGWNNNALSIVEELIISDYATFSISGSVTLDGSTELSGVIISDSAGHSDVTDANGKYMLNDLISGTYTLTPSKTGYSFSPTTRQVTVGPDQAGVDFTAVQLTYTISGQVTTDGTTALSGVTVSDGEGHSDVTDASGSYNLSNLAAGTYTITPSKAGYTLTPASLSVTVGPDAAHKDFTAVTTDTTLFLTADPGFESIHLTWNAAADPAVNAYRIWRATPDASYPFSELATISETYHSDSQDLIQQQSYCYKVEALSGETMVDVSNVDCAIFGQVNLWIPDTFAVAGTTVIVPVNIRNADGLGIASADIWMDFDPTVLECQAVSKTPMTVDFLWEANRDNVNGRVKISTLSYPPKVVFGDGSLFWLTFFVKGSNGATSKLDLKEFISLVGGSSIQTLDNNQNPVDVPLSLTDGTLFVQTTGMLGDVDNNGVVAAADALLALQMATGARQPTLEQQYTADVNGDGAITSADVTMILYDAVYGSWPMPTTTLRSRLGAGSTTFLSLGDIEILPDGDVSTTLNARGLVNWAGGDFVITFDQNQVVQVVEVKATGLANSSPLAFHNDGNGSLHIAIARNSMVSGDGTLAAITLRLASNTSHGDILLSLADARLNDRYGRDFVHSVNQGKIERLGTVIHLKNAVYLPFIQQ